MTADAASRRCTAGRVRRAVACVFVLASLSGCAVRGGRPDEVGDADLRRDAIAGLRHEGLGGWAAELAGGEVLRIGRTYLRKVKAMAGR